MISEQYWAATLLNEYESFSNWRRTGYPTLTPTNDPGNVTGGTYSKKVNIPNWRGASTNAENFAAAIARQGPNDYGTTKVWWDK